MISFYLHYEKYKKLIFLRINQQQVFFGSIIESDYNFDIFTFLCVYNIHYAICSIIVVIDIVWLKKNMEEIHRLSMLGH